MNKRTNEQIVELVNRFKQSDDRSQKLTLQLILRNEEDLNVYEILKLGSLIGVEKSVNSHVDERNRLKYPRYSLRI